MDQEKEKLIQKWATANAKNAVPKFVDPALLNDKEFVLQVIDNVELHFDFLGALSSELKKDKEIVIEALKHGVGFRSSIDPSLLGDKDVALALVSRYGNDLAYVSEELKNDKEVVLAATSANANAILYASDALKADKETVLFALSHPLLYSNGEYVILPKQLTTYFFSPSLKDDKEVLLTAVRNGFVSQMIGTSANPLYHSLPLSWREDEDIAFAAFGKEKNDYYMLNDVPKKLWEDKEFVLKVFDHWVDVNHFSWTKSDTGGLIDHIAKPLLDDDDVALRILKEDGGHLEKLSPRIKSDKGFVLTAIASNARAYSYASFPLQIDDEVILAAARKGFSNVYYTKFIKEEGKYYIHVSIDADKVASSLKMSAALAVGISAMNGVKLSMEDILKEGGLDEIKDVDKKIPVDEAFILEAMNNDFRLATTGKLSPECLEDKSGELYRTYLLTQVPLKELPVDVDKEVVMAKIERPRFFPEDFGALPERFRNDKEIIKAALKQSIRVLDYVSPEIRGDKAFMLPLIQEFPDAYGKATPELQNDKEVILIAIEADAVNYAKIPTNMRGDKEIALFAVSRQGILLRDVPSALRFREEILKAALDNDPRAFVFAPLAYRGDRGLVLKALGKDGMCYRYASKELKEDKEVLLAAVTNNGLALRYAPQHYKKDKEVVLAAVRNNVKALQFAYGELQLDEDIQKVFKQ